MREIGALTPEAMRNLLSRVMRLESKLGVDSREETQLLDGGIQFRNETGSTIPEFGLFQVAEVDNFADAPTILQVAKPMDDTKPLSIAFVNGPYPVENESEGAAQLGPIFRIKHDGGDYPVGVRIGWTDDSFLAKLGSLFTVLGIDDVADDVVLAVRDFSCLYGTATSEITSTTPGTVDVDGVVYTATTKGASIANSSNVVIWPYKGTWLALRVC